MLAFKRPQSCHSMFLDVYLSCWLFLGGVLDRNSLPLQSEAQPEAHVFVPSFCGAARGLIVFGVSGQYIFIYTHTYAHIYEQPTLFVLCIS